MNIRIIKGNLLEETHYYPHGLPIKGLGTSSDPGLMAQRRKYQSNEYIRSGLDWMSFGARQYDPQTGRFLGVDPLAAFGGQDMFSPYAAMGNMPEMMVDPNGMRFTPPTLDVAQAVGSGSDPMTNWKRAADPNSYGGSGGFGGGGGGGGGGFAPGFSSQGMSSTVLNTFWNILPPTMQEQAMIDYGSYGRQQQRIQDNNAVSNKFRELIDAIEDGTFNLSITRNSAFHYTINGTEIGAAKTKYVSNDNNQKDENTSDWMHLIGPGMIATGAEIVPKNLLPYIGLRGFVTPGATKFTSIASATLRATVPEWLPRLSWLPKAVSLGGQLGRAVPMVGWGVTVYDATYNGSFWLSDKIIQALPYNEEVKRNTSPSHWMMDAGVCFRQGTLVYTKVGLLKIETLKVGDSVFTYNLNTQMAELCRIDRIYKRITAEIYAVKIGSENIWVTQEHPFYVTGKGWVKVKDLKIGDKVKTSLGTELVLASNVYKKRMRVFNIEVAKNHDYFVTQSKILVHNKYIHSDDMFNVQSSENKHLVFNIKYLLKRILKIK